MTIISYLLAFFLTILIEVAVAFILGYRNRRALLTVICVNLITHPILHYLLFLNWFFPLLPSFFLLLMLEVAATLAEWRLLIYALRKKWTSMLLLSVSMNGISFIVGILFLFFNVSVY